jgi:hypothetical protein
MTPTDNDSDNANDDAKARRVSTGPGRIAKSSSPRRNENTSGPGVGAALRGVVDSALLSKLEGDLAAGGPIDLAELDRSMELGNDGLRDYLNLYYELLGRLSPADLPDADLDLPSEGKLASALEGLADLQVTLAMAPAVLAHRDLSPARPVAEDPQGGRSPRLSGRGAGGGTPRPQGQVGWAVEREAGVGRRPDAAGHSPAVAGSWCRVGRTVPMPPGSATVPGSARSGEQIVEDSGGAGVRRQSEFPVVLPRPRLLSVDRQARRRPLPKSPRRASGHGVGTPDGIGASGRT